MRGTKATADHVLVENIKPFNVTVCLIQNGRLKHQHKACFKIVLTTSDSKQHF